MSDHLTSEQLTELSRELDRQLARLERSMSLTEQAMETVELDQSAVGRLSRMDSLQNQSLSKGLRDREVVRHSQLREARARVESGKYGVCTACGSPLPYERLLVFPEAPDCAACGG